MATYTFQTAHKMAELTGKAREKEARIIFDYQYVQEQITLAANDGQLRVRITQKIPIDYSSTNVVRELEAKLKHKGYLTYFENATKITEQRKGVAQAINYQELVITWGSQKEKYSGDVEQS